MTQTEHRPVEMIQPAGGRLRGDFAKVEKKIWKLHWQRRPVFVLVCAEL